jgi:hypothetical protein
MNFLKGVWQGFKEAWNEYWLATLITFVLVVLILIGVASCGGGSDPQVPPPTTLRTDLKVGYYGSEKDQPRETRDHVNIFFEAQFDGQQRAIENINYMQMPTILSVTPQLFNEKNRLLPDGEQRLREFFKLLAPSGILRYVTYLYPLDEPDILNTPAAEVIEAARISRKVAAEFGFNPRLFVIYGAAFTWQGSETFDLIGFDNYSAGAKIFFNGDYAKLKAIKRPNQKLALIPGGAGPWEQDPVSFYNTANSDPDVEMIISFVWFDSTSAGQGYTTGIRSNSRRGDYCRMGKLITGKAGTC